LSEQTRQAVDDYLKCAGLNAEQQNRLLLAQSRDIFVPSFLAEKFDAILVRQLRAHGQASDLFCTHSDECHQKRSQYCHSF
jgi:hypothetical protein